MIELNNSEFVMLIIITFLAGMNLGRIITLWGKE